MIQHMFDSIKLAEKESSKLHGDVLNVRGMIGIKIRHLYNNICSMKGARYLEIGVWQGASTCSAMFNNNLEGIAIDNWSEFGGPKKAFIKNFEKYNQRMEFIEGNCWELDPNLLGKFNIFMYDGNHDYQSQYNALPYYLPCLEDQFIYMVDDWKYKKVHQGTMDSIRDNKLKVHTKMVMEGEGWHQGLGILVLSK